MSAELLLGDCLEVMRTLPDSSVDAVVTDPPYGLSDHTAQQVAACLTAWLSGEPYQPKGRGFMGKTWDAWVPGPEVWRECLRVLKPGGHILAFAGTRSMDLMCMAIRLAGFELRDSIGWAHDGGGAPLVAYTYGSGFPKAFDVSKAIDKEAGEERPRYARPAFGGSFSDDNGSTYGTAISNTPATPEAQAWAGWATALKPAWEPVILARRPLTGTVAANVLQHGTGALNVDGCRVGTGEQPKACKAPGWDSINKANAQGGYRPGEYQQGEAEYQPHVAGRWPANLIHDGSAEVLGLFPETTSGANPTRRGGLGYHGAAGQADCFAPRGTDTGSAARFFYTAKASRDDRGPGNTHPTVKPLDLMAYLCRLVTPPGGLVLDPFMGSGTTGKAAMGEGFRFVGIERDPAYLAIAEQRLNGAQLGLPL